MRSGIPREVRRNRDQFLNFQVPIGAQRLQCFDVSRPADKERIVDRDQISAVVNQRAYFIDQLRIVVRQINHPFLCCGKEGWVKKNTVKAFPGPFEPVDMGPEITDLEILPVDGESVEGVRSFRHVQEEPVAVEMNNASRTAR